MERCAVLLGALGGDEEQSTLLVGIGRDARELGAELDGRLVEARAPERGRELLERTRARRRRAVGASAHQVCARGVFLAEERCGFGERVGGLVALVEGELDVGRQHVAGSVVGRDLRRGARGLEGVLFLREATAEEGVVVHRARAPLERARHTDHGLAVRERELRLFDRRARVGGATQVLGILGIGGGGLTRGARMLVERAQTLARDLRDDAPGTCPRRR